MHVCKCVTFVRFLCKAIILKANSLVLNQIFVLECCKVLPLRHSLIFDLILWLNLTRVILSHSTGRMKFCMISLIQTFSVERHNAHFVYYRRPLTSFQGQSLEKRIFCT